MVNANLIIVLLISVIAAQTAANCFLSVIHKKERKDLYNRIMCRDMAEYSRNVLSGSQRKTPVSAHKKVLDEWRSGGGELQ